MLRPGHDFEAGNDGRMQVVHVRRQGHGFQHAVYAIAQPDGIGIRFEMNVRGPQAQRLLQNLVHKRRDGRLERGIALLALNVENNFAIQTPSRPVPRAASGWFRRRGQNVF